MPKVGWAVVGLVVSALLSGILWLDRSQARSGTSSLLGVPWGRAAAPTVAPSPPADARRPRVSVPRRRVAVLIDGLGTRLDVVEELLAIGRPVAVGVLPELAFSRRIARDAARAGLETLVQLPLEPYRYPEVDPGPGVLLSGMPLDEVLRLTRQHLLALPGAVGVATAMGSRFTEDRPRMRALLTVVAGERRFFVDDHPSQWSVGYDLARELGIPAARRQVRLDPDESEATIRAGLDAVERRVARQGMVLAVGHGRLLTIRLLAEAVPRWEARGIHIVPVAEILDRPAHAARLVP